MRKGIRGVNIAVKQTEIQSIKFTKSINALGADHILHLKVLTYWHFKHELL